MNCAYHPDREPIGACSNCGKLVCAECKVVFKSKIYCNPCLEEVTSINSVNSEVHNVDSTSINQQKKEYTKFQLGKWFGLHPNWTLIIAYIISTIVLLFVMIFIGVISVITDSITDHGRGLFTSIFFIYTAVLIYFTCRLLGKKKQPYKLLALFAIMLIPCIIIPIEWYLAIIGFVIVFLILLPFLLLKTKIEQ